MVRHDMASFILPGSESDREAEQLYADVRTRLRRVHGVRVSERRIRCLALMTDHQTKTACVGEMNAIVGGDLVLCIFEAPARDAYYICTVHHGIGSGSPFPVDRTSVASIAEFD